MTIKTWHDRIMELEDGVIVTRLHVTRYMQAEIDDLRAAVKSLTKDADRFNFLCDCDNEQALDLLAERVGQREELIALVDELIKEAS